MNFYLLRQKDQKPNVWSGGKTYELFLFPPEASYAKRNFSVRISQAVIEEDKSTFTSLPGFHRVLMPLTGPIKLLFEEQGEKTVEPYQAVEFSGSWPCFSYGKCADFGIMLGQGWRGKLSAIGPGDYTCNERFTALYTLEDGLQVFFKTGTMPNSNKINSENKEFLHRGDFLLIEKTESQSILSLKKEHPQKSKLSYTAQESGVINTANCAVMAQIWED